MHARVEVTGSGTVTAVPDVVRLDVAVRCGAPDVSTALGDAGARAAGLAEAARDHGVAQADLQTREAGVHPRHDREHAAVLGYTAHQSVRVTVRDPSTVGALVDAFAGVAGDALVVEGVALQVADLAPLLVAARAAAFADARAKAEQFAALAGRALGRVVWVSDVTPGAGPQPRYELMAAKAGGLPVELGENAVTATVAVGWEWE